MSEGFSELVNPTGNSGLARAQVHYRRKTIPERYRGQIRRNGVFSELVILVVNENVALSEVDGYCTYSLGLYFMAVTWPWAFLTLEMAQQCRCIAMKTRGSRHDICHGYYVTPMMTCRCTTKARRMDALPWDTVTGLPFHVLGQVTAAVLVSWQWLLYHHTSHTPGHCPFGQYVNMKHLRYIILVRIHYQSMWLETFRIVVAFAT